MAGVNRARSSSPISLRLRRVEHVPSAERPQPLKIRRPDVFSALTTQYIKMLDQAYYAAVYKNVYNRSNTVQAVAARLGDLLAEPRDVAALHKAALHRRQQELAAASSPTYMLEGRLVLLEVMGELASYYRHFAVDAMADPEGNGASPPRG